jgi:hypothetical protein
VADNDVSTQYMEHRDLLASSSGADEFAAWLRRAPAKSAPYKPTPEPGRTPLDDPFPTNRPIPPDPSMAGTVMRGVGEMPKQAYGGIEDAVRNATADLAPLGDWLNQNAPFLKFTTTGGMIAGAASDLAQSPKIGAPKTMAGTLTRSVSEFLTGFVPAMKGLGLAGMAGKVVKPLTASVIADFATKDPHEARLANLWQEAGLPQNDLTDYLSADPKDSRIEGRFKSAAESAFTGMALEGVMLGAKAVRAARSVQRLDGSERQFLIGKYGELDDKTIQAVIGDPSKPMISTVVKQPPAVVGKVKDAAAVTAGTKPDDLLARGLIDAGESQVYVNFARIEGPDEVKAMIGSMANRFKGSIDDATRGTVTHQETQALADQLGMTVPDVLARRQGQAWNAETALAARRLLTSSADRLLEVAKKAAGPDASPLDQYAFRRMMAVHSAIQSEVIGARTETARALSAWKIPAGGGIEKARAIEQMMGAMGGPDASQEMARRLAILAETGASPAAIARFVQKGWGATTMDAVREVWINGLLSSPATHVVNSTSNLAVAFQQIYERQAAGTISAIRGTEGGIAPGEAVAMAYGMVSSIKDAFRLAGKALKTGETGFALNKVDLPLDKAVSSEAFRIASDTGLGRAVDFVGEVARIPGRFLGAEDEFFKTIGYRMELHAQALRKATEEGLQGQALYKRMGELIDNPPENLRIAAADSALYSTFTSQPGAIGQTFMSLREKVPAVSFVIPFVRTPVNIARYAFERSPLAPLVGQWRDDIAAGGARADLALARMSTGSTIMAMALDWADSGLISGQGPQNAGEREAMTRQGWQQYSVKVGDRWYSFNRADPFGMTMGFAADVAEMIRKGEIHEDDADEVAEVIGMAIAAVGSVTINKTYLRGMAEFANVMTDGRRYGEQYVTNLLTSFLPGTALSGAVERAVDPTVRDANSLTEAFKAKIAGLSASLPPRRNLWGEEIKAESGIGTAYDFISPATARGVRPEPIDTEIMRLANSDKRGDDIAPPTRIGKRSNFGGVQVHFKEWPDVYDEYVRLAGNGLKHPAWGLGAKDYLSQVVTGNSVMSRVYEMRSDEMKLAFITKTIGDYRQLAQQEILNNPKFSEFRRYVETLRNDKQQRRMPVLN